MAATIAGSTSGVIVWYLAKLWPSLVWFALLVALTAFWFALRIFDGPGGALSPNYYRWSYGLTTFVFIVFPDILTQRFTGDDASMKFYQRLLDYLFVTVYSVVGVLVYDAVVDRLLAWRWGPARAPFEA